MTKERKPLVAMNDPNAVHCMVDIETLGSNGPIVQIGAVLFNPFGTGSEHAAIVGGGCISAAGGEFNVHVRPGDLSGADFGTVLWWMAQGQQAQQRVFDRGLPRVPLAVALHQFAAWSASWGRPVDFWWSDMDFDLRLLRDAWRDHVTNAFQLTTVGVLGTQEMYTCPFGSDDGPHRGVRDCRTLKAIGRDMGVEPPPFVGVEHDALDDAMHQAVYTANVLRELFLPPAA